MEGLSQMVFGVFKPLVWKAGWLGLRLVFEGF